MATERDQGLQQDWQYGAYLNRQGHPERQGSGWQALPYTLIGIIEKEQNATNYTTWIRARGNIIRNVSSIVYEGIAEDHDI